jgi:TetR/AcrR family transcriptional regulator
MKNSTRRVGRPSNSSSRNALNRVVDAACLNYAEHGIKGSSIQMIANDANVTSAMVHYYFKDKQDLHKAVLESLFRPLIKKLEGVESLDAWVEIFHGHLCENTWAPHLMVKEVLIHHGQLRPLYLEFYASTLFGILKSKIEQESKVQKLSDDFDIERHVLLMLSLLVFPFLGMEVGEELIGRKFDLKMKQGFRDDALNLFKKGIAGS